MYAGHFAAGLAMKAKEPATPTWIILLGVGMLDVLFGVFVMLGIERATLTPGVSPGFALDFIDWSHSLLMSLVWAVLYGGLFWAKGGRVAVLAALAVFSHYLLDLPMHPSDLALWPNASVHWGFGLWRLMPIGWWWVELLVIGLGCAYYVYRAGRDISFGDRAYWACALVLVLHLANSPWLKP